MTIRQHMGLLIVMRFSKMKGPMCRFCGTAIHRPLTYVVLAPLAWFGWVPFMLLTSA
ncbi:hypothetical protein [Streptomyces sp. SD15]